MQVVTDSETDPLSSLLSSFALGPAWARTGNDKQERTPKTSPGGQDRPPRRDDRGPRGYDGEERRPFKGRKFDDRRSGPPPREDAPPAEGIRATIAPDQQSVHLIGKEIHQVARVYALFDIAKTLLAEKSRCRAVFEAPEPHAPLIQGKLEESVFLTRDEAVRHLWSSELRAQLIDEEVVEVDPPTGNFQAIARCGISGEWLGPVNFHSYQTNLRRLHRERFARMPFEVYAAKVRTERGEEAVNAWLETMKSKTRWRIKDAGDDAWTDDRAEAERRLATQCFDTAYQETRLANVSGAIPAKNLSPSLLTSLRLAGTHARNHPAILIPAVCRAIEQEHLPVFKRQGKLHTGPARPHPLALDAVLAERPAKMVAWIRENSPAKLEGLWQAVLPEGSTAPPADYAADLFWLLQQGHILLYTNDLLVVQDARVGPAAPAEGKAKKKKKKSKKGEAGEVAAVAAVADVESQEAAGSSDTAPQESAVDVTDETPTTDEIPEISTDFADLVADSVPDSPETPVAATGLPSEPGVTEEAPATAVAEEVPADAAAPTDEVSPDSPAPESAAIPSESTDEIR